MKRINLIALTALMTVVGFNANGITETQRQAAMKKVFNKAQTPTTPTTKQPTTKTVSTEAQKQAAMKEVFDKAQNRTSTTTKKPKTTSYFGSATSALSTAVSKVLSYKKTIAAVAIFGALEVATRCTGITSPVGLVINGYNALANTVVGSAILGYFTTKALTSTLGENQQSNTGTPTQTPNTQTNTGTPTQTPDTQTNTGTPTQTPDTQTNTGTPTQTPTQIPAQTAKTVPTKKQGYSEPLCQDTK